MHALRRGKLHVKGFTAQLQSGSQMKKIQILTRINLIPARMFPHRLLGKKACWMSSNN